MSEDGKTEWFRDASNFHVRDGNIVHHGNPQGTRENVSYYPRAKGFSFDTLNITHFANGGRPPPPASGGSSSSSSDGFHHSGARPRNPRSATHDGRSTCQGWIEDYGNDDTPHAGHRPGVNPLQGQGQYPRTAPFRGMSTPSSYPSRNPFYGSYGPGSTLPTIPVQPVGTSAAGVRQDIPSNLGLRDDRVEEVQSDPEDDDWVMSDDEGVEEPEPQAGYMVNNVFIPRLLEWLATQHPSYPPTRTELLAIWEEYVPGIPPHGGLETHIITSAGDRTNAWRDGFRDQALAYLERHIRPGFEKDDSETRRRWAQTMKPSNRKRPPYPFYFKDPEKRTGSLLSDFITFTLSSHFKAISVIPPAQRSPMFPLGALALSLQACEWVLDIWGTGTPLPDVYSLRGSAFPEGVWQLVTTQLSDRTVKQKRILEAATQQLERVGRSIVPQATDP